MFPSGSVDSRKVSGCVPNTAVTLVFAFRVNEQLGFVLPAHGPVDHLVKAPVRTEAKRLMGVPTGKTALQVDPQSIPVGVLVTLPDAVPF
jgi:hypothetical protein